MNVALTFDDGPSEWTEPILDILYDVDAHATFFVCGAHVPGREHIIDRIAAEGHEIGNHTTYHPNLQEINRPQIDIEFSVTDALVAYITGQKPTLYRPPYLRDSYEARRAAAHLAPVGADVIAGDWAVDDPEQLTATVVNQATDRDVVLLHDGRPPGQPSQAEGGSLDTRQATVDAVALTLPALANAGYGFVTVSQLR